MTDFFFFFSNLNSLNCFLLSAPPVISESVKAQTESEMKRILDLSNTEVVQPVDLNSIDIRYHVLTPSSCAFFII